MIGEFLTVVNMLGHQLLVTEVKLPAEPANQLASGKRTPGSQNSPFWVGKASTYRGFCAFRLVYQTEIGATNEFLKTSGF